MKKFVLIMVSLITITQARMTDGVALVVDGEAITTAEIRAVTKQFRISKKKAIDMLIENRVQKNAVKNIPINENEVNNRIKFIASKNKMSLKKMSKVLRKQGSSLRSFKDKIRMSMKKDIFFNQKVASSVPIPNTRELKKFYNKHKRMFSVAKSFALIEYSAKSEDDLKTFIKTKKSTNIKNKRVTKYTSKLDSTMLNTFLSTRKGSFTKIFNAGDKFIVYKVLSKQGRSIMPFDKARNGVASQWKLSQKDKYMREYFKQLKSSANIQIIRK